MATYHWKLATLELPGATWIASAVPGGTVFALREDIAEVGGDVRWASFTVFLTEVDTSSGLPLPELTDALMRRRIPYGHPDRFAAVIDSAPALGFEYTDGVSLIRTHFCTAPSGAVVELSLRSTFLPTGEPAEPLADVAEAILLRLRWTRPSE